MKLHGHIAAVASVTLLSGCASNAILQSRDATGAIPALEFIQPVRLAGVLGGHFEISAGSVFLGDHASPTGQTLYCGPILIVDLFGPQKASNCLAYGNGVIVTNAAHSSGTSLNTTRIDPASVRVIRTTAAKSVLTISDP